MIEPDNVRLDLFRIQSSLQTVRLTTGAADHNHLLDGKSNLFEGTIASSFADETATVSVLGGVRVNALTTLAIGLCHDCLPWTWQLLLRYFTILVFLRLSNQF